MSYIQKCGDQSLTAVGVKCSSFYFAEEHVWSGKTPWQYGKIPSYIGFLFPKEWSSDIPLLNLYRMNRLLDRISDLFKHRRPTWVFLSTGLCSHELCDSGSTTICKSLRLRWSRIKWVIHQSWVIHHSSIIHPSLIRHWSIQLKIWNDLEWTLIGRWGLEFGTKVNPKKILGRRSKEIDTVW